jgi:hypothetical protein
MSSHQRVPAGKSCENHRFYEFSSRGKNHKAAYSGALLRLCQYRQPFSNTLGLYWCHSHTNCLHFFPYIYHIFGLVFRERDQSATEDHHDHTPRNADDVHYSVGTKERACSFDAFL